MTACKEAYGLRIKSEVAMPGMWDCEPAGQADLTVRWGQPRQVSDVDPAGEVVARYVANGRGWYTGTRHANGYTLRFHDAVDFDLAPDLRSITCHLAPGMSPEVVPVLLVGTTLSFLLSLAGTCVLHASAVEHEGTALAFVGESGMGKSTCAGLLCASGDKLVTDDVLVVESLVSGPQARRGSPVLRLRRQARPLADLVAKATWPTIDGRTAAAAEPAADRLPLAAIAIPLPDRDASSVDARRLPGAAALWSVARFPRVQGWVSPQVRRSQFESLARVVQQVPVFEMVIPWGPPFAAGLAEEIAHALATAGVAAA